jgi:DNA polymerase-1
MRHVTFDLNASNQFSNAILIKESAFLPQAIENSYIKPLREKGIPANDVVAFTLKYDDPKKVSTSTAKAYLSKLLPALQQCGVERIYCADAAYFKILTGEKKADPHLGYVLPCKIPNYENMSVVLGINYRALLHNPANGAKLDMSIATLIDAFTGQYVPLGSSVVAFSEYPDTIKDIGNWLTKLHDYDELTVDIETGGLDFSTCGIATVSFCWSEHEGIAFVVDYTKYSTKTADNRYGELIHNPLCKALLRDFFEQYTGKLIFHNAPFDTKVLIYNLWMDSLLDNEGLLQGLEHLYRNLDDTKIMAYLCLNSCSEVSLSLKDLAHEFAGNWAQSEISDVTKIPCDELLQYNLIDGLSTFYLKNKFEVMLVTENQDSLYHDYWIPYQKDITQIELTGMPIDMKRVKEVRKELQDLADAAKDIISSSSITQTVQDALKYKAWVKDYDDRVAKAKNPGKIQRKDFDTYPEAVFNPGSGTQLAVLLYEQLQLPVLDFTTKGNPSTADKTLKALTKHTDDPQIIELIGAIRDLGKVDKILTTFIPAFEKAILKEDGHHYLHGGFNLGGTVSGRLSSSKPNLQNIPSGSTYGKLIKSCFVAPKGWIFVGADFNSLEDYVSALTTKDPNKLKVYLDGYDGHCLRAYNYFKDQMPDIEDTVEGINSIEDKYPALRQESKAPTFALTYQGTFSTLMKNCGFSNEKAKAVETNYHKLYEVSTEWVQGKLNEAAEQGYVEVAFGLRVRTPMLSRSLRNSHATPKESLAEGRTAGNALGQSYGQLTNRSMKEFMEIVRTGKHRNDIRPCAMIHDANYLLVRDDVDSVHYLNTHLIKAMEWQDLPELHHDTVKLGAQLELYYPSWASVVKVPIRASKEKLIEVCKQAA